MSQLIAELTRRGLVHQMTPQTDTAFTKGTCVYWGIDPTGDSLHVGHFLGVTIMKRILEADPSNRIIILVGGGTAMIGDPGGKDEERPILPKEKIEENKKRIKAQLSRFFTVDEKNVMMVDNADWLENATVIEFLRDAGKYISVNSMIDKDSVKARITRQEGISYAEFSYQLLQAYDFMQLRNRYRCEVQIGGSDQWGNIVQGVELIRKKTGESAYAMSFPLIVNPKTGKKFGKSEKGASIWLDSEKTHPFAFYQFFINTDDELAPSLLKYYSFRSFEEIEDMIRVWEQEKQERLIQKELAFELTSLIHSEKIAEQCKRVAGILFDKGEASLSQEDLEFIKHTVPYKKIASVKDMVLEDVLAELGLASSKGEARRLVQQNGARADLFYDRFFVIKKGKREYGIVEVSE